ncbi:alpha/beta fold hydrolase [Limnoglobus roseus]|uniref:Alpha/beta hydrolase n=1 Tax=Limnoglobus roseus TaxID=2598579 RepID=A0A5C1AN87_9BACT|nr:alpha/beta hydrolase [Limnoglobus roseus]QEL18674.1 alpha/beta hydrolase [Limnoglobus roseus]
MRFAIIAFLAAAFAVPTRAEEKSFDSNGVKIAYLDEGAGEAVVLLHGFGTSAAEMWTKMPFATTQFVTALKGYRVLAPDHRGHGKSDKPHDPKQYGKAMAEDVVRLLDHAKVKKAHVVGYSMGAMIAGRLLVDHPDRLLSVTFGGGGPVLQPPKDAGPIKDMIESLEAGKGIGPLVLALTPEGDEKPTAEQIEQFSKLLLRGKDPTALAAALRGFAELEVTDAELKAVKVPVQFIHGSREVKLLAEGIAAVRKLLPKAEIVVINKGTHADTFLTAEFRKAVVGFLKAHKE